MLDSRQTSELNPGVT